MVEAMGRAADFRVFDISVSGIAFFGQSPAALGSRVSVTVGALGVDGVIVRASENSFAVHFEHSKETRAHLIRHVFSGRYRNAIDQVKIHEVALGVASRLWR